MTLEVNSQSSQLARHGKVRPGQSFMRLKTLLLTANS